MQTNRLAEKIINSLNESGLNIPDQCIDIIIPILDQEIKMADNWFVYVDELKAECEVIIGGVAGYYGLTFEDIIRKTRKREIVQARQLAMYLCRKLTNTWIKDIGKIFNKHHTTVIHAIKTVKDLKSIKDVYINDEIIEKIEENIKKVTKND